MDHGTAESREGIYFYNLISDIFSQFFNLSLQFDMHLENRHKVEERRAAMDDALRKKRDDLERREKEAQSGEMASEAKKLSRKEEILRLRAEGERLLEEEQAKWKLNKKEKTEYVRLKVIFHDIYIGPMKENIVEMGPYEEKLW